MDAKDLGAQIKEARMKSGLTLEELGKRVGWGRAYLSRIERGERNILARDYDRVMTALGAAPPNTSSKIMQRLAQMTEVPGANLELMTVTTSRLMPAAKQGDAVLIDTAVRRVAGDGIYLLAVKGGGNAPPELYHVRRMLDGKLRVTLGGDDVEEVRPDRLAIAGRVTWVLHRA